MEFTPNVKTGQILTNKQLMNIFRCGGQGGMRRSIKTNTLVLISDFTTDTYRNMWKEDGVWNFIGMGTEGNQTLKYLQNPTLYQSNENKIQLHLFRKESKDKYIYISRVLLAGDPKSIQEDIDDEDSRLILVFPLIEIGHFEDITNFLLDFSKQDLIKKGIINPPRDMITSKSLYPLMELMKKSNVDTLISQGGWFLNSNGYFYNNYASGKKMGELLDLIERNIIKPSDIFKGQNKYINPYFKDSLVYNAKKSITNISDFKSGDITLFRIKYLEISNDYLNMPIEFADNIKNTESNESFYTSLLIGPNGTGKSRILSFVQKIFTDLYRINISKSAALSKEIEYCLEYNLGEETYQVKQRKGKMSFLKNNMSISLKEMEFPEKVISCAFTLQDRFTILNEKDQQVIDRYEYLGIKRYIKNGKLDDYSSVVASNIMLASLKDKKFLYNLEYITSFLGFGSEIQLDFKFKNGTTMEETLNETVLNEIWKKQSKRMRESVSVKDIMHFVRRIRLQSTVHDEEAVPFFLNNDKLIINFNINNADKYEVLYEDFQLIWYLMDLKIFETPSIMVKKQNDWLPLEKVSSGEFQYFSTMINILSKIEDNSLIIIDEPETSLHPTWQFRYMNQLQCIFKKFTSCHFFIATHSHFMVADLKQGYSEIIALTRNDEDRVNVRVLDEMTFGRSVEDILYDVFDLPTNRNHYLANDLDEILLAISLGEIDNTIREKVEKIKSVQRYLKESDPLRKLIEGISKKVDSNV